MKKNQLSGQKGSIFLSTIIATFLMTLVGGYMYQLTSSELHLVHQLELSTQAQQLADAGLAKALSVIKTSWAERNVASNFTSTSLNEGAYQTTITTSNGRTLVTTTGTVQNASRTASAEMSAPVASVLDDALAGNSVSFDIVGQSSVITGGDVYADTNITLNAQAGSSTISVGNIIAGGTIATTGAGTNTNTGVASNAPLATWPVFDFNYYQNIAQNGGGTYVNGNVTYSSAGSMPSPSGHVIFVNGNVTISANQTTTAAIVATGSITITGGTTTITPPSNSYPAMMTQTGAITVSGTGNSNPAVLNATGLVYSGNNFTISGNHHTVSITGAILARGALAGNYSGAAHNDLTVNYVRPAIGGMTSGASIAASIKSYNT